MSILIVKLKEHDADRVVKYSVIKCLGPIFEHFIQVLKSEDERDIISAINTKLHIEIEKSYILEQINKIPNTYRLGQNNVKLYRETLEHVANNLGSSNAELNYQVM